MTGATKGRAVATVMVDNERTRVTHWRFPPGAATGFHRHDYDYCVVPLSTGTLRMVDAAGAAAAARLTTGEPYFRNAGVEHDVVNDNDFEFSFIDIEYK